MRRPFASITTTSEKIPGMRDRMDSRMKVFEDRVPKTHDGQGLRQKRGNLFFVLLDHSKLQLPHAKFYPDFVAMLTDGRILVVEYKGAHLYEGEAVKRHIGAVWAEASGGQCLFCMPTKRDFALIDRTIE